VGLVPVRGFTQNDPALARQRSCLQSDESLHRVILQSVDMRRNVARRAASADIVGRLSADELSLVLSALWMWRSQLDRVGSEVPIPGLGTVEARHTVDEIACKLGAVPDAYFYGLKPSQRR
jgi:hypothetical protein